LGLAGRARLQPADKGQAQLYTGQAGLIFPEWQRAVQTSRVHSVLLTVCLDIAVSLTLTPNLNLDPNLNTNTTPTPNPDSNPNTNPRFPDGSTPLQRWDRCSSTQPPQCVSLSVGPHWLSVSITSRWSMLFIIMTNNYRHTKVGWCSAPNGANARGGQHCFHRLNTVWQITYASMTTRFIIHTTNSCKQVKICGT